MDVIDPCLTKLKEEYNCKYICHENSEQLIKNCLSTSEIRNELKRLKLSITDDNMTVDDTIDELRKICINISDKSFTIVSQRATVICLLKIDLLKFGLLFWPCYFMQMRYGVTFFKF